MNKILSNPIIIVIFTAFFILFFLSLKKNEEKIRISTQSINSLQSEVKKIEEEVSDTEDKLYQAQNPLYKEKIIRDQLLMQKEGEYVLQIPSLEKKEVKTEAITKTPWQEWMELIF